MLKNKILVSLKKMNLISSDKIKETQALKSQCNMYFALNLTSIKIKCLHLLTFNIIDLSKLHLNLRRFTCKKLTKTNLQQKVIVKKLFLGERIPKVRCLALKIVKKIKNRLFNLCFVHQAILSCDHSIASYCVVCIDNLHYSSKVLVM